MEKKNNSLVIILMGVIIVILAVLCVLFATDTISFKSDSVNNNNQSNGDYIENSNNENNDSEVSSTDIQTNSSWTSALLSRHILEAKVTRLRSKDLGDSVDYNKTITISMDEVKSILSVLENNKLTKTWSQGRGGPDRDYLTISYEYNDQKYEFDIHNGTIGIGKLDDELKDIFEKNKYDEKNTEYKDSQGSFYYYNINNYSESIFDKYFN